MVTPPNDTVVPCAEYWPGIGTSGYQDPVVSSLISSSNVADPSTNWFVFRETLADVQR
jgi:hypothetical protein